MVKKEDRRIVKTKKKLGEALFRLLRNERLEEIRINNLCHEAGVSRATFYNNFRQVSDVVTFQLSSLLLESPHKNCERKSVDQDYRSYLREVIHGIREHREELIEVNKGANENILFTVAMRNFHYQALVDVLTPYQALIEKKIPMDLLLDFLSLSLAGFTYYILKNPQMEESQLIEYGFHLSYRLILDYLNKNPIHF